MSLSASTRIAFAVACALVVSTGCEVLPSDAVAVPVAAPSTAPSAEQAKPTEEAKPAEPAPTYYYSPFVVRIQDDIEFQTISFKDVGLKRKNATPTDPLLEALAQSLSYEMGAHSELSLEAEVSYDPSLLDPNNHTFCGTEHIYVDVWRKDANTWGYSLWSGCGEEDNFEWREVEAEVAEGADLPAKIAPLTKSIVASLAEARQTHCFRKTC